MEWDREIDDLEIVKILQDDPTDEEKNECVEAIYNKYHSEIKGCILRKLPDINIIDWELCVQEVFGKFFTTGYKNFDVSRVYSSKNCLRGYLRRCADNDRISGLRERKKSVITRGGSVSREYDGDDDKKTDKVEERKDESILPLDERVAIKEMFEVAMRYVCQLKNKIELQCVIINAVFLIKQKIIHKIFGYPEGTIKSYVSRALKKVQNKVEDKYGHLPSNHKSELTEISEEVIREKLSPEEYYFIENMRRVEVYGFGAMINKKKVATIRTKLAYIIDRIRKSVE